MRLLGLAGSFREGSFNRGLLRAAAELTPEGVELVEFDLRGLPFYDGDLEAAGDPESVTDLKEAIRDADGLVIATPEYNRGLPAVLKNAIDWASRPALASPLAGKPVAIMGATTGFGGTARAQQQLREALEFRARSCCSSRRCSSPRRTWASTSMASSSMSKPARRSGAARRAHSRACARSCRAAFELTGVRVKPRRVVRSPA